MPDDQRPRTGSSPIGAGEGRRRRRRGLRIAACAAAGVVLLGATGAGYVYYRLNSNIHSVDINGALGRDRPAPLGNGSMDILVLGSDSRSGANDEYGHDSGTARSDTAMIVHLDKGHTRASVVSIPRDTLDQPPVVRTDRRRHRARAVLGHVQHGLRGRRPGLRGQDRRAPHRAADGPLRRGRLHRLQEPGQRPGRRAADHHAADPRPEEPPRPGGRHPHPQRRAGARPGPHPARRGRRQRPRPYPAPAGVHEGAHGPGERPGAVHQPDQAVLGRRHRDQGGHHRLRARLGEQADGPGAERAAPARPRTCTW